jgi:hypothetical protein
MWDMLVAAPAAAAATAAILCVGKVQLAEAAWLRLPG